VQKPYPIYDQNGQNQLKLIPYLWPKPLKNHTLWGHTYLYSPYKGVPPLPHSSSASVQKTETQLVAYIENNTVQALGVPLESCKVIHGKPIPKGSICVQVSQMSGASIRVPIVLRREDENSFFWTSMFFALPLSCLFSYVYLKSTNSVKISSYAIGTLCRLKVTDHSFWYLCFIHLFL